MPSPAAHPTCRSDLNPSLFCVINAHFGTVPEFCVNWRCRRGQSHFCGLLPQESGQSPNFMRQRPSAKTLFSFQAAIRAECRFAGLRPVQPASVSRGTSCGDWSAFEEASPFGEPVSSSDGTRRSETVLVVACCSELLIALAPGPSRGGCTGAAPWEGVCIVRTLNVCPTQCLLLSRPLFQGCHAAKRRRGVSRKPTARTGGAEAPLRLR